MKEETIVSWNFRHLFEGKQCVAAKVHAPKSNPGLKGGHLEKIEMVNVEGRVTGHPRARVLMVSVHWHEIKGQRSASWSLSLFETLENAGAAREGCIKKDSLAVFWELKSRERFTDGAMRIAQILFRMLDIRLEGEIPFLSSDDLISLFIVYKVAWVGKNGPSLDDYLRKRHGLPEVPAGYRTLIS